VIVVDIGCMSYAAHPEDESMMKLIRRFQADFYYGFDPHPAQAEYDGWAWTATTIVRREAAWIYDGEVGFTMPPAVLNPLRSSIVLEDSFTTVKCFDLARWIAIMRLQWGFDERVILKMDCEGAEYDLIEHLEKTEGMSYVDLLLVEWHGDRERPSISVPWEEW